MAEANGALVDAIVVISDLVEPNSSLLQQDPGLSSSELSRPDTHNVQVRGGYLERLPLAAVRSKIAGFAEIWHHHRGTEPTASRSEDGITRRAFPVKGDAPFHSQAMIDFIAQHGAPRILCIWGLGVSEQILEACADSIIIYNSIDVPAIRVPPEVSRHFDIVLTGAQWQSDEVLAQHPHIPAPILPVGPEFASPETFFPLPKEEKRFDVIYVAAAQPYKRHDILFDALARSPQPLRAFCVIGYGEDADRLRHEAASRSLDVEFVGPPGVSHSEVNRFMNQARVGVVCGVDDGAPAILTEYMLAGLPVVANADLRCGLQYILPETGVAATAERFEFGILEAMSRSNFMPRQTVLERWAWPHSIRKLASVIGSLETRQVQRQEQSGLVCAV